MLLGGATLLGEEVSALLEEVLLREGATLLLEEPLATPEEEDLLPEAVALSMEEVPLLLGVNALLEGGLLPIEFLLLGVLLEVGVRPPVSCSRPRCRARPQPLWRTPGSREGWAPPGTPPSRGTTRGPGEHPPPRLRPLPHHHPRRFPPPPRLLRRHQNTGLRFLRQPNPPRRPPRPQPQPWLVRGVRRQLSRASRWRSSRAASRPPAPQPRSRMSPPLASRPRCGKR